MRAVQLIVVLAVIGVAAGTLVAVDEPDEAKAIAKIELLGGKIEWDETLPGRPAVGVSFEGSERFSDRYIYLLKALPNLTRVDMSGSRLTDEGLTQLPHLKKLVELNLYDTSTTRAAMTELRQKLPNVWIVDDWMITNLGGGFDRDKKGRILRVSFTGSQKFGDHEMRLLKPLKYLEMLELNGTRITDSGLKELSEHRNLNVLCLKGTNITDVGMKTIGVLKNLQNLFLDDTKITDDGLVELQGLENLKQLELSGTRITDEGLKTICELKTILGLNLGATRISDAGLKDLGQLPLLSTLNLMNTKITDHGLKNIKEFNQLGVLNLRGTRITDAGLNEFQEFRKLYMVFLGDTQVTETGFDEFKNSKLIRQVDR